MQGAMFERWWTVCLVVWRTQQPGVAVWDKHEAFDWAKTKAVVALDHQMKTRPIKRPREDPARMVWALEVDHVPCVEKSGRGLCAWGISAQ
jgi:hypothetical protein